MLKIELIEQKSQPVLSIRTNIKVELLPQIIGRSYKKIFDYLNELDEKPVDVPFISFHSIDVNYIDVEIGLQVSRKLQGKDDIIASEIPEGKYVSSMYKGSYTEKEKPYKEIFNWILENGYEITGLCNEFYYNSPLEVPESELLTKLLVQVV